MQTNSISIVIITKNAISTIADVINASQQITNEIIVVDSGSSDGTDVKASDLGATVVKITWQGYGPARNYGAATATRDFVLYLDSDEVPSVKLIATLQSQTLQRDTVYGIKRRNFIGRQEVRYGDMARDNVYRIHYRLNGHWSADHVHEKLEGNFDHKIIVPGHLNHYTSSSIAEYSRKLEHYASLGALEKAKTARSVNRLKPLLSAAFTFARNYIFRLGILDGTLGWQLAHASALYTFNKYKKLRRLLDSH